MGVSRTCQPCKAAKAKCDLGRPSCGRCTRRYLTCSGYPADAEFIFLDENERAQRNSERARKSPTVDQRGTVFVPSIPGQQSHSTADIFNTFLRQHYSWLSSHALTEIPGPLKRDLETRAVDRFFVNWILHPGYDGVSPGYMHDLPTLYLSSSPGSVLWLVIRAMAFADMRDARTEDAPFYVIARQHYGAGLASMRQITNDEQNLADDRVLAALLFIDCFEMIYLARDWKSRPHDGAIRHIIRTRGEIQLYDQTKLALWIAAHHRLQVHQLLLGEEPDLEQIIMLNKLNISQPDVHLSSDILQMNILVAAAKKLTRKTRGSADSLPEKLDEARGLIQSIEDHITSFEMWTANLNEDWKPGPIDPVPFANLQEAGDSPSSRVPTFEFPVMLTYHDLWITYLWNLHAASQIILRESLVELIKYGSTLGRLGGQLSDLETTERIERESQAIERLSSAIMQSFPLLMGFADVQAREPRWSQHGKMVGRYFCIFSMWIVRQAELTSPLHKETAAKILKWIASNHNLH